MEKFLKEITKKAGKIVFGKFGKVGVKYTKKNAADVVTEADLAANKFLLSEIKKKYPNHGIVSEETGDEHTDREFVWYIDPLDGTRNYSVHLPLFCVMVGLMRNGKMFMGAVYDPVHDSFYFAKAGGGAFLNGRRIQCSQRKDLVGSWGSFSARVKNWNLEIYSKLLKVVPDESIWINSYACTGINAMDVASGKHDWFISNSGGLWDYAAPSIILQEAGCKLADRDGNPWILQKKNGMVAANRILHKKIIKAIIE